MPLAEYQVADLKRAYQVLGLPLSASVAELRRTYHRLLYESQPNQYPLASPEHAAATQKLKSVADAYAKIQYAPLRYRLEGYSAPPAPPVLEGGMAKESTRSWPERPDRLEFCVRFVCGAVLGAFIGLRFLTFYFDRTGVFAAVLSIVSCGLLAAKLGDDFWYAILRRCWFWWW